MFERIDVEFLLDFLFEALESKEKFIEAYEQAKYGIEAFHWRVERGTEITEFMLRRYHSYCYVVMFFQMNRPDEAVDEVLCA